MAWHRQRADPHLNPVSSINPNSDSDVGSVSFQVGNNPYCAWCTRDTNCVFLKNFDTDYYFYVAELHGQMLVGDYKHKAALSLRIAYYNGLETLFMLMFAAFQAPYSVAGWLLKCKPAQLRQFIDDASNGSLEFLSPRWKIEQMSWGKISELINERILAGREDIVSLQDSFAKIWRKFAADFTADHIVDEYNSFKHGFRAYVGGGPTITFHPKEPSENMPLTVSSEFGSSFFVAEKLADAKAEHLDHHFTLKYCHVNLQPEKMVASLQMIGISIKNLIALLRLVNGFPLEQVQYALPAKLEAFDYLIKDSGKLGFEFVSFNLTIPENTVSLTRQQITQRLNSSPAKK